MTLPLNRRAYVVLAWLFLPWACLRLLLKGARDQGYWRGLGERFGALPRLDGALWIHAVSVGEVRAAAGLVRALGESYPDWPLLVTTTTPSGARQAAALFGDRVHLAYLGFDLPFIVTRMLDRVRPRALLVIETEWWPTLFRAARQRAIPVVLINARLSQRSAARYARVPTLARETLATLTAAWAQADPDANRLVALGLARNRVTTIGNLKFDIDIAPDVTARASAFRATLATPGPVWVAASTHEGEEALLLATHAQLRLRFPNAVLVLVPRHPIRASAIARLVTGSGQSLRVRTDTAAGSGPQSVYLADTLGELLDFLAAGDLVVMGGSFVPHGGHNPIEPCALGVPVLWGPHMDNFAEVARLVAEAGAGAGVSPDSLGETITLLLGDPARLDAMAKAGPHLVAANRGALARTLSHLRAILAGTPGRAAP